MVPLPESIQAPALKRDKPAGADQRQGFVHRLRRGPGAAAGHAGAQGSEADKVRDWSSLWFHK